MATNKYALIRYKILDKCFRNLGKKYFINDLIEECTIVLEEIDSDTNGISRRQIFDDITFMESKEGWNIDLIRHKESKKVYYRYADTNFSINDMPLNEIEIVQLREAIDILSQFKGMPQFEWVNELIPKLNQGISTNDSKDTIIEFDNNQYLKGIEFIGELHNAIFYKKALKITYKSFTSETSYEVDFHPYYLKQYNNRWFLFGYNPLYDKSDWNLALDRIISIKELKSKYIKNTTIYWNEYFEDIIGVTKPENGKVENIVLQFNKSTGNYIFSKPVHGSQKAKWINENTLEISLNLIVNYEFERLILSYADSVTIIKPKKLISSIKTKLKSAFEKY